MGETPSVYANVTGAELDAAPEPKRIRHKTNYGSTALEVAVLHAASWGLNNSQIASALELRPRTVDTHFEHILHKSQVPGRADAVLRAIDIGDISFAEATGGLDLLRIQAGLLSLTPGERTVFDALLTDDGIYRNRNAVAEHLVKSPRTVSTQLEGIYKKLDLHSEFMDLQSAIILAELRRREDPDYHIKQFYRRKPTYFELRELGLVEDNRDTWQVTRDVIQCALCPFSERPLTTTRVIRCSGAPSRAIVNRKMGELVRHGALRRVDQRDLSNRNRGDSWGGANEMVYQATEKIVFAPGLSDSAPLAHCQDRGLSSTSSHPSFRQGS